MRRIIAVAVLTLVACSGPTKPVELNRNVSANDLLGYWYLTKIINTAFDTSGVPTDTTTQSWFTENDTLWYIVRFTEDSVHTYEWGGSSGRYTESSEYYSVYHGHMLSEFDSTAAGFDTLFESFAGKIPSAMPMELERNELLRMEFHRTWDSGRSERVQYHYQRLRLQLLPAAFPQQAVVLQ